MNFWLFLLLCIPLCLIVGVASATIGFSAFGIIVPVLFVILGFSPYDALFVSVAIDFVDSLILVVIFHKKHLILYRTGLLWSIPSLLGAVFAIIFFHNFILDNTEVLRGSVGYVIMILGLGYIGKGISMKRKEERRAQEPGENDVIRTPNSGGNAPGVSSRNGVAGKAYDDISGSPVPPLPRFSRGLTSLLMGAGVVMLGVMGGVAGIGNGTSFILLLIFLFRFDLRKATGTGCLMMLVLMVFCALIFSPSVHFNFIWPYLLPLLGFSVLGTLVASHFVFKLSEPNLTVLVGVTTFIAASTATLQKILLSLQ